MFYKKNPGLKFLDHCRYNFETSGPQQNENYKIDFLYNTMISYILMITKKKPFSKVKQ